MLGKECRLQEVQKGNTFLANHSAISRDEHFQYSRTKEPGYSRSLFEGFEGIGDLPFV